MDVEKNGYYNPKMLATVLKKYVPFVPLCSGLLCDPVERFCNSYVENYFATSKKKIRRKELTIGKLPKSV